MKVANNRARLSALESILDARQLFLDWMKNAPKFRVGADYRIYLFEKSPWDRPLAQLIDQLNVGFSQAMAGKNCPDLEQSLVQGRRDLAFLFFLYKRVNDHLTSAALQYGHQAEGLIVRFLEIVRRKSQVRLIRGGTTLDSQLEAYIDSEVQRELEDLQRSAATLMGRIYATKAAIDLVNQKNFGGQLILWTHPVGWLDSAIAVLESGLTRIKLLAESVAPSLALPPLKIPEPEKVRATIDRQAREEYLEIVRPAIADMLSSSGEYETQRDLELPEIHRLIGESNGASPEASSDESSKNKDP
jgi:hypothetical protein